MQPYQSLIPASPTLLILLPFLTGILLAEYVCSALLIYGVATPLLFVFWIVGEGHHRNKLSRISCQTTWSMFLLLLVMTGATLHSLQLEKKVRYQHVKSRLQLYAGEEAFIDAKLTDCKRNEERFVVRMEVSKTRLGQLEWKQNYHASVVVRDELDRFGPCSQVRGMYRIRILESSFSTNPGQFDPVEWMNRNRIQLQAVWVHTESYEEKNQPLRHSLQERFIQRVESLFRETEKGLAIALLTGVRSGISEEKSRTMARAGLSHIMAVSGLHVGILIAPFWFVLRWSRRWKSGPGFVLLLLVPLLIAYCSIAGFRPSVSRASLMGWFWMLSAAGGSRGNGLNLLSMSALILLVVDSTQLFDIGFQLSYSAVLLILFLVPVVRRKLPSRWKEGVRGNVLMILVVSTVVQAGLAPLLIWYFEEVSIAGPVANLMVLPILTWLLPWMMALTLLPVFPEGLMGYLILPGEWGIAWIRIITEELGDRNWSWISIQAGSFVTLLFWILVCSWFRVMVHPERRSKLTVLLVFMLLIIIYMDIGRREQTPELEVTILDVGQGDAIHIRTPEGRNVLVDSGRWTPYGDSGRSVILPYLKSEGIDILDVLVLTHPHADHIGGAAAVLESISVGRVYYCGGMYQSGIARRVKEVIREHSISMRSVAKGDMIDIDPSIRVFVMGPRGFYHDGNPNDHSVMLKVVYNETAVLLVGDAEREQEERAVEVYGDFLKADLLKAGHHGSRTSSGVSFLRQVQPTMTVVSSGIRNRFGHPHREAMDRLGRYGGTIHHTALEGWTRYRSDGVEIRREP